MSTVDLAYERPPRLYPFGGTAPAEAWDIQIAPPPAFTVWQRQQVAAGHPATMFNLGAMRAKHVVAGALPTVPMEFDHHRIDGDPAAEHLHIAVAMRDADGRPVDRAVVEQVATEAWIAHLDKLVAWAHSHPERGLHWTRHGITGVDQSGEPEFACPGFYEAGLPVIVAGP